MDSAQKTSLLLEMNLRFLSANLQLNSLLINSLKNSKAIEESHDIMKNILGWLQTLNQYAELPDNTNVLVGALIDSVKKSNNYNLLFDFDEEISKSLPETKFYKGKPYETPNDVKISNEQLGDNSTIDLINETNLSQEKLNNSIDSEVIEDTEVAEEDVNKFYNRKKELNDQWDYVSSIKTFMSSYTHLMHNLIPNLALEVAIELNRYDCNNKLLLHDTITNPTLAFQNLITKLLREAPGSNLFRRIKRIRSDAGIDLVFDQQVNISEIQKIKEIVSIYFETLTKYLDPSNPTPAVVDTLFEKTKGNYLQFSLGPITIEARLTAVIKNVAETSFKESEEAYTNDAASTNTKVIYLATTQLICDFQNFLLSENRILVFLQDLKS